MSVIDLHTRRGTQQRLSAQPPAQPAAHAAETNAPAASVSSFKHPAVPRMTIAEFEHSIARAQTSGKFQFSGAVVQADGREEIRRIIVIGGIPAGKRRGTITAEWRQQPGGGFRYQICITVDDAHIPPAECIIRCAAHDQVRQILVAAAALLKQQTPPKLLCATIQALDEKLAR